MVLSTREKSSTLDKGKLSCLHAHGLAFPISAVDKEKKKCKKNVKKIGGLCFQVLGWGLRGLSLCFQDALSKGRVQICEMYSYCSAR